MLRQPDIRLRAFTLVEIMVVAAIISLIAVIAVPNWLRARERSQASVILEDLRLISEAIDQFAVENNSKQGDTASWAQIHPYIKTGTRLQASGGLDLFGNSFGSSFTVDTPPKLPAATFSALSDTTPAEYWAPFY
ncbi:MAG: type II secretion system protein [Chthoniobacteraceae bacterium]